MDFQQAKKKQLSKIDKSSIGSWDSKIKKLCGKINKNKKYYTTSSCAGRILLIKGVDKKIRDVFLFRTHDKIGIGELKKVLDEVSKKYNKLVEFQQTTCILHVACDSLVSAQNLVNKAKQSGWKHSGIMTTNKRFMVELHSTEKISFPIMNKGKVLVDDDFLKIVVKEANSKLERVWKKIKKLSKLI
tara:strand:+ start:1151 stop:1711 length:561 start_codon:yes stop_codon:yes gene_type:complete